MIAARLLLGALVAAGSFLAARALLDRLGAPASILRRWLAEAVVTLSLLTLVFFSLLTAGLFRVGAVVLSGLVLAGLAVAGAGTDRLASLLRADRRALQRLAAALAARPERARLAALVGLLCVPGLVRTVLTPPLGWDAQVYHLLKAQLWVHAGAWHDMTGPGPWAIYGERPAGASALRAVGMLLAGEDVGATVLDPFFWGLGALGLLTAARALGVKEPWGSWGATFVVSVPPIRLLLGSGYSEPLALGVLAAAVASGLSALRARGSPRTDVLVSGAGLGLAVGVSPTLLPVAVAMGGALTLLLLGRGVRRALPGLALALLAASLLAGPWYLRTTLRLGLPLSPLDVRIGPLTLGTPVPEAHWYEQRMASPHDPAAEVAALARIFGPPWSPNEALSVLALVPLLVLLARPRMIRRGGPASALLAVLVSANLVVFGSSGFAVVRRFWPASSSRFLLPALLGVVLLSLVGRRSVDWNGAPYGRFLVLATLVDLGRAIPLGVGLTERWALLVFSLAVPPIALLFASSRRGWRALGIVSLLGWVVAATGTRDALRWTFVGESWAIYRFDAYWAPAAESLDDGRPHVVAVTSGPYRTADNWLAYAFGGSRFQNGLVYVPTSRSGQVVPWARRSGALEVRLGDPHAWLRRLRKGGVTHVMSFAPQSLELVWMEQRPELFRRVTGSRRAWGLFELGAPGSD